MNDNLVIVRDWMGRGAVRVLLKRTEKAAFVCRPQDAPEIHAGTKAEPCIGFPVEDVFEHDPEAEQALARGQNLEWGNLKPVNRRPSRPSL